ncbi:ester cyclase [Amycolatopsis thermalba]|uniref:Ester cyclase n=1 Tax=Amycolatopsis thermalba TaxID=944492 RepID=A0ABY4P5U9_9PSEU|nr:MULTISPECIES: ester cyclase [Amycolatopsis]UQS27553.1 ester cyclase [Amycolatopsis thermalba]
MTSDERRERLRRVLDLMWNQGELDACEDLCAPHCTFHDPNFEVDGVAGFKRQVSDLRTANPDLHMDIHDVLVDGDLCAMRFTVGGTSRAEFRGLPATGKTYVMTGMMCGKWADDRLVEMWVNYDLLGALQQLGIISEMAPRETAG